MTEEEVSFSLVHPRFVDHCWIEAGYYLNRAAQTSRGRYTVFDIKKEIYSGTQHLWILFKGNDDMIAALTTMFVCYPSKKNLCVAFVGSNDDMLWTKHVGMMVEKLEDFARENYCDAIECTGREGWARLLAKHGWEKAFTVLEREIK